MGPVDFVTFRILTRFPSLPSPPFNRLRKEVWNVYFSNVQLMGMISFTSCSVPFYVLPRLFLTPLTTLRIDRQSIFMGWHEISSKHLKSCPFFHTKPMKSMWLVHWNFRGTGINKFYLAWYLLTFSLHVSHIISPEIESTNLRSRTSKKS